MSPEARFKIFGPLGLALTMGIAGTIGDACSGRHSNPPTEPTTVSTIVGSQEPTQIPESHAVNTTPNKLPTQENLQVPRTGFGGSHETSLSEYGGVVVFSAFGLASAVGVAKLRSADSV